MLLGGGDKVTENRLESAGKKMQDFGKKGQKLGGTLTVLITIPIILTIWLGVWGAVIGGLIFIIGLAGALSKKE